MRPRILLAAAWLAAAGGLAHAVQDGLGADVESLLAFARERHPELAAMRHAAEAARAGLPAASALPDPMLGIELRDFATPVSGPNLLPARVGSTRYTLTQTLPWAGKRDLQQERAAAEAAAADSRAAATWADLAWQIKQAFARRYLQAESLRTARENLALLDQLERIAAVRYASGLVPQQDALRAQSEHTALAAEIASLEGEAAMTEARLKALLGGAFEAPLASPAQLRPAAALPAAGALAERLRERNPRLATETALSRVAEKERALVYRNRYPDFKLGVAALQERTRIAGYDLMFEVNIPLQQDSRRAQELAAERQRDAATARREAVLNAALAELGESQAALDAARRVETLLATRLLPQAELTVQAALAGYENGKVDFAAVLDAQRQLRQARVALLQARVDQEARRADIERAIGEEL